MNKAMKNIIGVLVFGVLVGGCSVEETPELAQLGDDCPAGGCQELTVGQVEADQKTDGIWTEALKCKPIPELEPLVDPAIVVSLDGLTLRLFDRAGSYDKVFPIGPGAIDGGSSLTPTSTHLPDGVFYARADKPARTDNVSRRRAVWAWNYQCRFWGDGLPYFAGLPFVRLEGTGRAVYGFHGPIDRFTRPDGGQLRRGFVSHGCIRLAADDIVEVFALIQGHKVPVRVQKAVERLEGGKAVDVEDNWFQSECEEDADCRYDGGVCRKNPYSGRGFCTASCESTCPDKLGYPTSRCVADPEAPEEGVCLLEPHVTTNACGRYDSFVDVSVPAFGRQGVTREVCLPGPRSWIGSRCLTGTDCESGTCAPFADGESSAGVCTQACDRFCPDAEGAPGTFCVEDRLGAFEDEDGMCVATCLDDSECPSGLACQQAERFNESSRSRSVCLPR